MPQESDQTFVPFESLPWVKELNTNFYDSTLINY